MIKGIIFDMDGTILNTLKDIEISVNHALMLSGFPIKSEDEIRKAVGNGAKKLIERVLPTQDEETFHKVYDLYQAYYDLHADDHTKPYEGIIDVLNQLKKDGFKLAVVSNKVDYLVKQLNEQVFSSLFDAAIGERKGVPIKPHPDMLFIALNELGLELKDVMFVGDSDTDMLTANQAKIDVVAVTWGFRDEDVLSSYHPRWMIHHPKDLLNIVKEVNNT